MEKNKKQVELPHDTEYNFLYERNKDYMNYIALIFDKLEITYEELHTRIDEYTRALAKKGVEEGDIIAVGVGNTPESAYLAYALNKLGAIVCPINPIEEEVKMLGDLQVVRPKMFIGIDDCKSKFKHASKGMEIEAIYFPAVASMNSRFIKTVYQIKQLLSGNSIWNADQKLSKVLKDGKEFEDVFIPPYREKQPSEFMFTGGSSGTHKAAELDGNGLNCVVRSLDYVLPLQPGEIFMGNLPQFIAFGKLTLHYALCKNLKLNMTLKGSFPQGFTDELFRIKPAGVFAGPIHWESFIRDILSKIEVKTPVLGNIQADNYLIEEYLNNIRQAIGNSNLIQKYNMSWLKTGVSGGEMLKNLTEMLTGTIFEALGCQDVLWNGLGMTEMWAPVAVKKGKKNSSGTIGNLIPFNRYKIIDKNTKEEVPTGKEGMLCVTGPGMFLRYHENPSETEKVFYVDQEGTKWYMTGDIVKANEEDELTYIERDKRSFVCGIENVYPQQIENVLSNIPEIEEVIVTKIPDDELQFIPKYHISLKDPNCDTEYLKKKIEKLILQTLGNSFLAREYQFYTELLPRTANKKLDPKPLQANDNEQYQIKMKEKVKKLTSL